MNPDDRRRPVARYLVAVPDPVRDDLWHPVPLRISVLAVRRGIRALLFALEAAAQRPPEALRCRPRRPVPMTAHPEERAMVEDQAHVPSHPRSWHPRPLQPRCPLAVLARRRGCARSAEAEIGMSPGEAAEEIERKAKLELLDPERIIEGLRVTGHGLVPLIWDLDRVCEGDAGGYVHWGATTQNITQTARCSRSEGARDHPRADRDVARPARRPRRAHEGRRAAGRTHGQHAVPSTFGAKVAVWIDELCRHVERLRQPSHASSSRCSAAVPAPPPRSRAMASSYRRGWASCSASARCRCPVARSSITSSST